MPIFRFIALMLLSGLTACFGQGENEANRTAYMSFDGTEISYQSQGTGPLVLLLHGLTSNGDLNFVQTGIASALVDAGYQVVIPDMRGHGASDPQVDPDGWPRYAHARDQIALFKHLETKPVAIIGYSMGAHAAMKYQMLTHDDVLLVLGGVGSLSVDETNLNRNLGLQAAVWSAMNDDDTEDAAMIKALTEQSGTSLIGVMGALKNHWATAPDLLAEFDCPVLVINGSDDQVIGSGQALAEMFKYGQSRTVEGTHFTAPDNPSFVTEIISWLDEEQQN